MPEASGTLAPSPRRATRRAGMFALIALALPTLLPPMRAGAQLARSTFAVDLSSGAIAGTLPFDEPFILSAPAPSSLREVRLWVGSKRGGKRAEWRADCRLMQPRQGATFVGGSGRTDVDPRADGAYERDSVAAEDRISDARTKLNGASGLVQRLHAEYQRRDFVPFDLMLWHVVAAFRRRELDLALAAPAAIRIAAEPTAVWNRQGLDSVGSLLLEVGGIKPNRDYTFCFQLVREPTKAQADTFALRAAASLSATVQRVAARSFEALEDLDSLQLALIAALPKADSIEIADPKSLFRRPPRDAESEAQRTERLDRLSKFYVALNRQLRRGQTAASDARGHRGGAEETFRALLASATTLRKLATLADDSTVTRARGQQFAAAGPLARRLSFVPEERTRYIRGVVEGVHSIDQLIPGVVERQLASAAIRTDVQPYQDSLQLSMRRVDELRALVEYARSRPRLRDRYGLGAAELAAVGEALEALLDRLREQQGDLKTYAASRDTIAKEVQALVTSVAALDFARIALRGTTSTTFQARANLHMSLDAGLLGAVDVYEVVPYLGVNMYFRPVNKNAPLKGCWKGCFGRRFALTFGVTAASIAQQQRIDDLFASSSALLGAGTRLTDYWRVTAGSLILKTFESGSTTETRIQAVPAAATSLDIDVITLLGKLGSALFPALK